MRRKIEPHEEIWPGDVFRCSCYHKDKESFVFSSWHTRASRFMHMVGHANHDWIIEREVETISIDEEFANAY